MWSKYESTSKRTSNKQSSTYTSTSFNSKTNTQYSEIKTEDSGQGPITHHTFWTTEDGELTSYDSTDISPLKPLAPLRPLKPISPTTVSNYEFKFKTNTGVLASIGAVFIFALLYRFFSQDDKEKSEEK